MTTASEARESDPRITRTRAVVMKAVSELLVDGGLAAITIDAVLARSGVARATVYRHWPTRRALLLDGLNYVMPPPPAAPDGHDARSRIEQFLTTFAHQLNDEPWSAAIPALLDAARRDAELGGLMTRFLEVRREPLLELLRQERARGNLRKRMDMNLAVSQLLGPLVFRRLITAEAVTADVCRKLASDFVASHRISGCGDSG